MQFFLSKCLSLLLFVNLLLFIVAHNVLITVITNSQHRVLNFGNNLFNLTMYILCSMKIYQVSKHQIIPYIVKTCAYTKKKLVSMLVSKSKLNSVTYVLLPRIKIKISKSKNLKVTKRLIYLFSASVMRNTI